MKKYIASILLIITFVSATQAHKGATGIVKVRMDEMSAIGKNMKQISQMLNGETSFNAELLKTKANEISNLAKKFPYHFKEEIKDNITQASPKIWQTPDEFNQLSNRLAHHAKQLADKATVSEDLEKLKEDFKIMAGTCKSCHAGYRVKK
ncbi:MAG: cytochrome c [Nitratireductor sp.]